MLLFCPVLLEFPRAQQRAIEASANVLARIDETPGALLDTFS
jgi:hypothetical protein